jgi:hypothetical protein
MMEPSTAWLPWPSAAGPSRRRLGALHQHTRGGGAGATSTHEKHQRHPSLRFAHPHAPLLWNARQWAVVEARQKQTPLLDMARVRGLFDRPSFLRDGVLVLPGVMRQPEAWAASLSCCQELNDDFVRSDWGDWVDWGQLGADRPTQSFGLTAEEQHAALGNSQAIHSAPAMQTANERKARLVKSGGTNGQEQRQRHRDRAGEHVLRRHSVIPEYFPCGHDPFLMEAMLHPDMLSLHKMLIGEDEEEGDSSFLRFDHSQLFTRPAQHKGVTWHSHVIGGEFDVVHPTSHHEQHPGARPGPISPSQYGQQPNVIFTLCCACGHTLPKSHPPVMACVGEILTWRNLRYSGRRSGRIHCAQRRRGAEAGAWEPSLQGGVQSRRAPKRPH